MKRVLLTVISCAVLLCGCAPTVEQIESFGAEYSANDKYMAMLPEGISIPMEYDDVIELKGTSQIEHISCWYQGDLFYTDNFFNKPCILGMNFEDGNLKELAYIYECESEKDAEKVTKHIYRYLESCYGKPTFNNLTFKKYNYFPYAKWLDFDKCDIDLTAQYTKYTEKGYVICEISFDDEFAGIKPEPPSTTTTTTSPTYEWKLKTNSTGKDWNKASDTEKNVWCSNSITAWRVMGYDIPSSVSISHMHKSLDYYYENADCVGTDLTTASEAYAIASGIY